MSLLKVEIILICLSQADQKLIVHIQLIELKYDLLLTALDLQQAKFGHKRTVGS